MAKIIKLSNSKYIVTMRKRLHDEAVQPKLNFWGKVVGVKGFWSAPEYVYKDLMLSKNQAQNLLRQIELIEEIKEELS